jgi:LacI family transcriptional regulator
MTVTMKQVAKASGVVQSVVSEILAGKNRRYRAETVRRVTETTRRLGYRPNWSARAMRRGRFHNITLLVSATSSYALTGLLEGLLDAVNAHKQHLSLAAVTSELLRSPDSIPHCLRETNSDGVVVNYWDVIPVEVVRLIHRHRWPCVWINLKQDSDCVYPDDVEAGLRATRTLIERGHRRIAYMNLSSWPVGAHYSAVDRRAGYESAVREAGLTPLVFDGHPLPQPDMVPFLTQCLREHQPTALVTYGDREANVVPYAAAELGLAIPRDLSVMTFGQLWPPHLKMQQTMLTLPLYEMGKAAVERVLKKIEDPVRELPPVALPCGFHAGQTCAAPREAAGVADQSGAKRA